MIKIILNLLLAAAAVGLAAQAASAQDLQDDGTVRADAATVRQKATMVDSLAIPDELYPAVRPYMICRQPSLGPAPSEAAKTVSDPVATESCEGLRARGTTDGIRILRSRKIGSDDEQRREQMLQLFAQIDEFLRPPTVEELEARILSRQSAQ
jgi:hypothetical protein